MMAAHQHTWPRHVILSGGTRSRWLSSLLRHKGHTRSQKCSHHHSLQKANTQKPISSLGQQPFHCSKTQCLQHTSTQGQGGFWQQPSLIKELDHIKKALQSCHFFTWALNKLQQNFEHRHYVNNDPGTTDRQHNNNHNNTGTNNNIINKNLSIVVHMYRDQVRSSRWHATGTLQGFKHNKDTTHGIQEQGHQITEK